MANANSSNERSSELAKPEEILEIIERLKKLPPDLQQSFIRRFFGVREAEDGSKHIFFKLSPKMSECIPQSEAGLLAVNY